MSRPTSLASLGLWVLGLWAVAPVVALAATHDHDAGVGIARERRQQRTVKELLGFDRWRRLEAARFDFDLHQQSSTPELLENNLKRQELEDIFMSSLLRLGSKRLQRAFRLMERRDEMRAKLRGGPQELEGRRSGLDISPRLRAGTTSSLGVRFRLRGLRSRFWSGASLRLRQEVGAPSSSVKFAFRDGRRSSYIVYETAHESRGESVEFGFRYTF